MMKPLSLAFLFLLWGFAITRATSQSPMPEVQPTSYQAKILYNYNFPFKAYRALKGSDEKQLVVIYPGAVILGLADCGIGPKNVCPYILYIYTGNTLTDWIELSATKTYRIFWLDEKWQVEEVSKR